MNKSFWARLRLCFAITGLIVLAATSANKAHAQAWGKLQPDGSMVTIGITEDGKYPIYLLKVDKQTQATGQYPSDGYIFSSEELPQYMVRVQPADVGRNGYKCLGKFCYDRFNNLIGLNPEIVKVEVWNTRTIPPVDHEARYKVYPINGSDLNDIAYTFRNIRYSPQDLSAAIPPIRPEDVNKNGYRCDFLCVNAEGKVVGWNPLDKRIAKR